MKYIIGIAAMLLLTACSNHTQPRASLQMQPDPRHTADEEQFQHPPHNPHPLLTANDYSRTLVHELMSQHRAPEDNALVGVTDFSFVDTALDQGSVLSNHLSEAIMYDLHKFGVAVLDHKVTGYIRVTDKGDFVLSRNFAELTAELPIRYVVTGTMTQHKQGVLINARLIRIDTKQVISAARTFMPNHVARAIISQSSKDVLQLKQG